MRKNHNKKLRKEAKRKIIQAVRRRTGWKPPAGMVIYSDRY